MSPVSPRGSFLHVAYAVPEGREESLAVELWLQGTLGYEVSDLEAGRCRVDAYFPLSAGPALPGAEATTGVEILACEVVTGRDWLAAYRRQARPLQVGRRLVVDPGEPRRVAPPPDTALRLRIPARCAFGTGSHESTRLILDFLEGEDLRGREVLDVGTGSGILALSAVGLGARRAVAFDIDPVAAIEAGANKRLNALPIELFAGSLGALKASISFDLILINIVPDLILGELDRLVEYLRPGGDLLLSGLMSAQRRRVATRLRSRGLRISETLRASEWACLHARRPPV